MTAKLFNRSISVQIGSTLISARPPSAGSAARPTLRMVFNIKKSLAPEPNKSILNIYNLSSEHRKQIKKDDLIIIRAGYAENEQQIFSGSVAYVSNIREAVNWNSKITCLDGGIQYSTARLSKSYGKNTTTKQLLLDITQAMGVGIGNAVQMIAGREARKGFERFSQGVTVNGRVSDLLDKYASSFGLGWSIQDGQLQLLPPQETLTLPAVLLRADTGLIGSPEYGEAQGGKKVLQVRSLLNGNLIPGRQVFIKSDYIEGFFRINKVTFSGDTWGAEWVSDLETQEVSR